MVELDVLRELFFERSALNPYLGCIVRHPNGFPNDSRLLQTLYKYK